MDEDTAKRLATIEAKTAALFNLIGVALVIFGGWQLGLALAKATGWSEGLSVIAASSFFGLFVWLVDGNSRPR